jgi:hypothetical protein
MLLDFENTPKSSLKNTVAGARRSRRFDVAIQIQFKAGGNTEKGSVLDFVHFLL